MAIINNKIVSSGGKKMSKELKITTERIRKLAEGLDDCRDAQQAVKDAFPEAFGGEDITEKVEWSWEKTGETYFLNGNYEGNDIFYVSGRDKGIVAHEAEKGNYEIKVSTDTFCIFKKT